MSEPKTTGRWTDIAVRLRAAAIEPQAGNKAIYDNWTVDGSMLREAAAEIERLRDRVAELEEAARGKKS